MVCTLCKHPAYFFGNFQNRNYNRCTHCASVFLDAENLPSTSAEQKRYEHHRNSETDSGYLQFLKPLIDAVSTNQIQQEKGLDYGSGPNPVLTKMLQNQGYDVKPYDLFFSQNLEALKQNYDYIVCCEVIEHFHNPREEFDRLRKLLVPGGNLYCKTNLLTSEIDFKNWWYKNDLTHTFFYTKASLEFIKTHFKFKELKIYQEYFRFSA
ncbi:MULTISPECIES: class I SAM-dependent methyltransferase [unclassified Leeuwenhoekiella]|uniref:class I SAM-dependent methyltransferase n=1 Tax=unclassified Leeuwenhoekiella TaxID=2615029 RepID=UPI000C59216C|nr:MULTISPECIES: class I SAM-dependent methyltransferase [unclassified Leeuwenhoekiella]MAW95097.1 methyltransferase [Leeuwenhoekiella sp.]MBA79817.1 methyltransferase [Leeuwenhoekiella sp.]|tara:strand:+ start:35920 stop:36546 length:627 start_codon:yes stop_codon:yes gene_type:complete